MILTRLITKHEIVKLTQIGRVRARTMYNNKLCSIKDVKKTDLTTLSSLIGKKIALNIKKHLNQEEKPVKKGTRKGQLSIQKYQ